MSPMRDPQAEYEAAVEAAHEAEQALDRLLGECRERLRAAREWLLETRRRVQAAERRLRGDRSQVVRSSGV